MTEQELGAVTFDVFSLTASASSVLFGVVPFVSTLIVVSSSLYFFVVVTAVLVSGVVLVLTCAAGFTTFRLFSVKFKISLKI